MYLIVIHVPFQDAGPGRVRVGADWGRSLHLLRDSLRGRLGPVVVAAPALPAHADWTQQPPVTLHTEREQIFFVKLCDADLRPRRFWRQAGAVYRRCLALARKADVVHAGMNDLFRPISPLGFRAAVMAGRPTVFVEDTDAVAQLRQLSQGRHRWRTELYCRTYEQVMRWAVARADLALLKGRSLHARYGRCARNARDFQDTSYSKAWVIPEAELNAKLAEATTATVLRCVSIGRLVSRKGVDETLRVVAAMEALGISTDLEIIGDGPEAAPLRRLADTLGLRSRVRFSGPAVYGRDLVARLRRFHIMLFTPTAEDTPRSLFDALAAGLPVAGYAVDYVQSVLAGEQCGVMGPVRRPAELAREVARLWHDRPRFSALIQRAAAAGRRNAAEAWYARRAEWTLEAVRARRLPDRQPAAMAELRRRDTAQYPSEAQSK